MMKLRVAGNLCVLKSGRGLLRRSSVAFMSSPPPKDEEKELTVAEMESHMSLLRKQAMETWVCPPHVRMVPDGEARRPDNPSEMGRIDAMPLPQKNRTVTIMQNRKCAMTSGWGKTKPWHITWPKQEKWTNPVMGWTSSADPMHSVDLEFDTREEAIYFAENQGWKYDAHDPIDRYNSKHDFGQIIYAHNFLPKAHQNIIKTKGKKQKIFFRPKPNDSHYFRPLSYHGEKEVPQYGLNPDTPWK